MDSDTIGGQTRSNPEEFIHIFVKNTPKLIEFLEFMIEIRGGECSPEVHNTLLELYLQSYKNEIKEDVSFDYIKNIFLFAFIQIN